MEVGCGKENFWLRRNPGKGVGINFSNEMIRAARARYPHLSFFCADAHNFDLDGSFDYIILSDLLNDLYDAQAVFDQIRKHSTLKYPDHH